MMNFKQAIGKKFTRSKFVSTKVDLRFLSSTIFAIATGTGKCGLAVIRVSGKSSSIALKNMTR